MDDRRPPWWIYLVGSPFVLFWALACLLHIAGPEPVGWILQQPANLRSKARIVVGSIEPDSPAAQAGLHPGDLLLERDLRKFVYHEEVGREYRFDVERHTGERQEASLVLSRPTGAYWLSARAATPIIGILMSALNLLLAAMIVLARSRDTAARWGALTLASISAFILWYGLGKPTGIMTAIRSLPVAAGALLLFAPTVAGCGPPIIVTFLAGFPRSAISRRGLWILFWVLTLPGIPVPAYSVWGPVYSPDRVFDLPKWIGPSAMITAMIYCCVGAFLVARNYAKLKDLNERRRARLVVLGFIVSLVGIVAMFATVVVWQTAAEFQPFPTVTPMPWVFAPVYGAAPLCLAYAILRHRMFDIRIMIRQGIQYAAARGLVLSVVPLLALVLVLDLLLHGNRPLLEILGQRGLLYLALGAAALLLHARQKTWLTALDRRFFRERYEAQRVLGEAVEEIRAARDFEKAARRVVSQIEATLHPETTAFLVRQPGEAVYRAMVSGAAPLPPIPAQSKIMGLLRLLAKPIEIPPTDTGWVTQQLPREETESLRRARLEWLFPVSLGGDGAEAILALGPKRSEEPYSREDQDLIKAITASLALLLERSPVSTPLPGAGFEECPQCGACYDSGTGHCTYEGAKLTPQAFPRLLARRYRFERRLGRGGMGTVYEALDAELERRVAVKLIRPELMASPEAAARFKREAKVAAGLSHPNVVTVFDFGVGEDQRAYLVMELLHGRTLRQELQRRGRLSAEWAGKIIRDVCAAVAAAHERRLLHRDLKPENIFLAQVGGTEVAKVLDFGVAKLLAASADAATLGDTASGVLVGTVQYMSPEQLRGGPPGESWDLWALAVMAYEMLAGAYPFAAAGAADWRHAILTGTVIPLRVHVSEAPEAWNAFFCRTLASDLSLRPSSVAQFVAEFQKIAA